MVFPKKFDSISCLNPISMILIVPLPHEIASISTLDSRRCNFLLFLTQFFLKNDVKADQINLCDNLTNFFRPESDTVINLVTCYEIILLFNLRMSVLSNRDRAHSVTNRLLLQKLTSRGVCQCRTGERLRWEVRSSQRRTDAPKSRGCFCPATDRCPWP